jgi:queuine/archaeosine tRNA-ribosyltransferase
VKYTLLKTEGQARRGRLELNHGVVETPVFMPVGTYGTVKAMTPAELTDLGAQIVLGNTFHLWLRPGMDVVRKHDGVLARCAAKGDRGRRGVPVARQWRQAVSHTRRVDAHPARAQL